VCVHAQECELVSNKKCNFAESWAHLHVCEYAGARYEAIQRPGEKPSPGEHTRYIHAVSQHKAKLCACTFLVNINFKCCRRHCRLNIEE
jgi:hypothetical protein